MYLLNDIYDFVGTVCSHFITKDPDQPCCVILEDGYIITQEGEL